MEASEDYYIILGISRDANEEQIKKAYRKSALRWHPDKNLDDRELAERNFKRLAEAYEVLSDPQKRQVYDRYGKDAVINGGAEAAGPGAGFGFGFPGMADLFGGAFGGAGPFGGGGPGMFFSFRDPNDVFRDFFGSSNFDDIFADMSQQYNNHHQQQQANGNYNYNNNNMQQQQHSTMSFMDPAYMLGQTFGALGGFGGLGGMNMQMSSSSTASGGPGGVNVKRISTSVKVVNGKRVETKKVVENGVETVTVTENGRVKSRTVNGQPQLTN